MTASGNTVTLTTPIAAGTLQIMSYRFALVGNEFQVDLGLARSGTFSDQIVIFGVSAVNAYSSPWGGATRLDSGAIQRRPEARAMGRASPAALL